MLRVLVITPQFPPNISGGLGRQVGDTVRHLERDVKFGVIAPTPAAPVSAVESFPFQAYGDMSPTAGIAPLVRMNMSVQAAAVEAMSSHSWDVIHAHGWAIGPAASQIAMASGLPLISTIHADNSGQLGGSEEDRVRRLEWEESLVQASSIVTAVSTPLARSLSERYLDADIRAVPNGIELPTSLVDHSNVNSGEILYVGRLVPYKGVQDLLNAMPVVLRAIPNARLRIVGDGFYTDALKQLQRQLRLEDVVEFTGWLDGEELRAAHARADLLVAPSHEEAFGLSVAEGMATGVPVVASDCPAFQALVDDGVTGRLFQTGSVNDLAHVLIDQLQQSQSKRWQLINAARAKIERQFSWQVVGEKYLALYGECHASIP